MKTAALIIFLVVLTFRLSFAQTPAQQEVLQFEPVTRGRFEKSEPTIVEGQDLDIPTFLRKNIRVK